MLAARLGVKDLDRELRFYESVGFEVARKGDRATVRLGQAEFTLLPYDLLRTGDAPLLDWDREPTQVGSGIQLFVLVDDVDAFAEGIKIGVPRPWPVQDKPWGYREVSLKSPSGYILTFATPRSR